VQGVAVKRCHRTDMGTLAPTTWIV
ncbi:uncharacterized protein METZ01_LOCUS108479, partial [marine metagenome]